jgi:hypothetical protein
VPVFLDEFFEVGHRGQEFLPLTLIEGHRKPPQTIDAYATLFGDLEAYQDGERSAQALERRSLLSELAPSLCPLIFWTFCPEIPPASILREREVNYRRARGKQVEGSMFLAHGRPRGAIRPSGRPRKLMLRG